MESKDTVDIALEKLENFNLKTLKAMQDKEQKETVDNVKGFMRNLFKKFHMRLRGKYRKLLKFEGKSREEREKFINDAIPVLISDLKKMKGLL